MGMFPLSELYKKKVARIYIIDSDTHATQAQNGFQDTRAPYSSQMHSRSSYNDREREEKDGTYHIAKQKAPLTSSAWCTTYFQPASLNLRAYIFPMSPMPMRPILLPSSMMNVVLRPGKAQQREECVQRMFARRCSGRKGNTRKKLLRRAAKGKFGASTASGGGTFRRSHPHVQFVADKSCTSARDISNPIPNVDD
jgi:hypothetical protein